MVLLQPRQSHNMQTLSLSSCNKFFTAHVRSRMLTRTKPPHFQTLCCCYLDTAVGQRR
eukprot:m.47570 g.47570  ORF g.47570 m.47570 type:complete len:58 (-) comp12333_c0_seq1:2093-2266(-)